jgi:hypothetical protein
MRPARARLGPMSAKNADESLQMCDKRLMRNMISGIYHMDRGAEWTFITFCT